MVLFGSGRNNSLPPQKENPNKTNITPKQNNSGEAKLNLEFDQTPYFLKMVDK